VWGNRRNVDFRSTRSLDSPATAQSSGFAHPRGRTESRNKTRTPSRDTRIPPKMLASPSSTPLDHSGDNSSATMPSILPAYTVPDNSIRISIDRGGTFTDVHTSWPDASGERQEQVLKLLSVDPSNYADAPTEACRRVLELATGQRYPRGVKLDTSKFDYIRCGSSLSLDVAESFVGDD
jgi:hypothetical protein